jgi:hypothetical protein
MPTPSWLLLVWSGFAATCAAATAGSLLGGRAPRAWALVPRPPSASASLAASLLAGAVLYPIFYGLAFEITSRADVLTGLAMGTVHGSLAFALSRPAAAHRPALRLAAMHVVYGATIAFLYVTP